MKTLILYLSKKGFTKKCAEYLLHEIEDSEMYELDSNDYNFEDYDKILVGAPIYFGSVNKDVVSFLEENKSKLLKKKLGMFFSGMLKVHFTKTVQQSVPAELFYHSEIVHSGGAYYFNKLNFIQRFFVKRIAKVYKTTEDMQIEELRDLI